MTHTNDTINSLKSTNMCKMTSMNKTRSLLHVNFFIMDIMKESISNIKLMNGLVDGNGDREDSMNEVGLTIVLNVLEKSTLGC